MVVLVFFVSGLDGRSQDVATLQRDIRRAEQDIRRIDSLLADNVKEQRNRSGDLSLISKKIANRRSIITRIDAQVKILERTLGERGTQIVSQTALMDSLKRGYALLLAKAYRSYRSGNFVSFVLASEDFSQAQRRLHYVGSLNKAYERRAMQIDTLRSRITTEITELRTKQSELRELLADKNSEMQRLAREQTQHKTLVARLEKNSKALTLEATTRRKQMASLQREIERLVALEAASRSKTPSSSADASAEALLTGNFAQNRGLMPPPVEGAVVIDKFGITNHPTQAGVKIDNKGLNYACRGGSVARAVFEGEIRRIFVVPGMGTCVMIRHGAYLTVYSNLANVFVKVGDRVKTAQRIGAVTDDGNSQPTLHFELWHETQAQDPALWIRR